MSIYKFQLLEKMKHNSQFITTDKETGEIITAQELLNQTNPKADNSPYTYDEAIEYIANQSKQNKLNAFINKIKAKARHL